MNLFARLFCYAFMAYVVLPESYVSKYLLVELESSDQRDETLPLKEGEQCKSFFSNCTGAVNESCSSRMIVQPCEEGLKCTDDPSDTPQGWQNGFCIKEANPTVLPPTIPTNRKLGESCGSCYCPPSYTMGDCEQGLECKHDNQNFRTPGTCVELGPSNQTTNPLTGTCKSWNGKVCNDDDRVDVGRGAGSCNSNRNCPCCAPFCSKAGYCQNHESASEIAPTEPPAPCYENCINSGVSGWDCMSHCNGAIDGIDDNTNGDQNNGLVVKCPKCCAIGCKHRLCANRDICPVKKCPKCCPRCRLAICADHDICPVRIGK